MTSPPNKDPKAMRERTPIMLLGDAYLLLIGDVKRHRLYISAQGDLKGLSGYVDDKDVYRLKRWCETILKSRKRK